MNLLPMNNDWMDGKEKKVRNLSLFVLVWFPLSQLVILIAVVMAAFYAGRLAGALDPERRYEIPMCAAYETDVRANPTGYIIGHVPAGSTIWFMQLELPFARVAYYDGSAWLEGTITATALQVCE